MRTARLAAFAGLVTGMLAVVTPVSVVAIAPVGGLVLQVTDCKTGQPIVAGEAEFAIPRKFAVAVSPIDDGVVGPIGLGDNTYVLTMTSPGYRPLHRVLQGTGDFSTIRTVALCMHPVAGSPEHLSVTTYSVDVTCSPASGELCSPAFSAPVTTADILELQFTASNANCGAISVDFQVDGFDVFITDPLAPGDASPVADVGPQIPGAHGLTAQATGIDGGCNTGDLAGWAGTLTVTTDLPVGPTTKGQCLKGGWAAFDAFQSQGDCINYVVSAGKH